MIDMTQKEIITINISVQKYFKQGFKCWNRCWLIMYGIKIGNIVQIVSKHRQYQIDILWHIMYQVPQNPL